MSALNGKGRTVQLADGPFTIHYTAARLISLEKEWGSYGALLDLSKAQIVTVTASLLVAAGAAPSAEAAVERVPIGSVSQVRDALVAEMVIALGAPGEAAEKEAEAAGVDPTIPATPSPGTTSTGTRG